MNFVTRFLLMLALIGLSVSLAPRRAGAWGEHGHQLSGRAAALKLPAEMPAFFRQADNQLTYLNPEPDRWRDRAESQLEPAVGIFAFDHYIDLELVPLGALGAPDRYAFVSELVKAGRKPQEAGFLPYRILELFQRLRIEFKLWRAEADPARKAWIEQRILNDAGVLGHYVSDGANPHHTTIHHNGWVGENPKNFTTDKTMHGRFETEYVKSHIQLNDLLPLVAGKARLIEKPREELQTYLRDSFSKVEELYELEKREPFGEATKSPEHKKFVQARLAAGAQLLRDLWWTAWVTSDPKEFPPPVPKAN